MEARTQNQETEAKTLARQKSTKIKTGAMHSPRRKQEKGDIHTFHRFILRSARERVTENRDKVPMSPSRGYVVPEQGSRKLRHDGDAACYETGQAQPADGRSRKTTRARPTVSKRTTRRNTKLAEKKQKPGDTPGLRLMSKNQAS